MGNGIAKLTLCFSGCHVTASPNNRRRRLHFSAAAITSEPLDEGLGHSFCYKIPYDEKNSTSNFYSISGAAVSANASTALSTTVLSQQFCSISASKFDSSSSFNSYPLCPNPKFSGPISSNDRGFFSGPIEPGFLSGALDPKAAVFSGPLDQKVESLRRSLSHGGSRLMRNLSQTIRRTISVPGKTSKDLSSGSSSGRDDGGSLQWAQGKAGEDRVHVVVAEEFGWIFVGIYDGFNGPDATDYLLSNLYSEVQNELKELVWLEKDEVLMAMSRALMKTEDMFFEMADNVGSENPELALMGSCVLAMLMKGEDVYLMNVGDSRAVLGQKFEFEVKGLRGKARQDLERISEGRLIDHCVDAVQLTLDHSTCVEEEVRRIRREHPDDACAVMNDRVKGSLKVTRAFGAGFLKQPKWNDALLEMFRIDYVGTSPYITCSPFLYHHKLGPKDRFLILTSDGLYQYFTNEEAVSQVELFITTTPEGDPAQHLVEEVIFRAAKKAGLDFHELLEIPQGDRRRYHDDVSIIIISFEGRIWRSCT